MNMSNKKLFKPLINKWVIICLLLVCVISRFMWFNCSLTYVIAIRFKLIYYILESVIFVCVIINLIYAIFQIIKYYDKALRIRNFISTFFSFFVSIFICIVVLLFSSVIIEYKISKSSGKFIIDKNGCSYIN